MAAKAHSSILSFVICKGRSPVYSAVGCNKRRMMQRQVEIDENDVRDDETVALFLRLFVWMAGVV